MGGAPLDDGGSVRILQRTEIMSQLRLLTKSFLPVMLVLASASGVQTTPLAAQASVPASVTAYPSELVLSPGETAEVRLTVRDAEGREIEAPVVWVSSNTWSVKVSNGMVEALRPGQFRLLANALKPGGFVSGILPDQATDPFQGYVQAEVLVTVRHPAVATVEILAENSNFYEGATLRHRTKIIDRAGDERRDVKPRWSTSDPQIATVDQQGQFTAHRPGRVTLVAEAEGVRAEHSYDVVTNPIASVNLRSSAREVRTGDVVNFRAMALDRNGREVADAPFFFSVDAQVADSIFASSPPASVDDRGRFVAEQPGHYNVFAITAGVVAFETVTVIPRDASRDIFVSGRAVQTNVGTTDIWVWEANDGRAYAITGTIQGDGWAHTWDVTDVGNMHKVDSVQVDARTINDAKVSEDGQVAVITREGASDRRNGLVLLDVSDPRNISILSSFDDGLTGGVHNAYIYEDHVYALSGGQYYDIINIEDPRNPYRVSSFRLDKPGAGIHDVWVHDGIAYSSQWQEGVILVDVGNGIAGGSPSNPVQFAQYAYPSTGGTHSALPFHSRNGRFYVLAGDGMIWPGGIFMDEANRVSEPGGYIHIIDFTDINNPEEVARYEVPETGPHYYYIDDDEILWIAHYTGGFRAVDVSGDLRGNLYTQGREVARFMSYDPDGLVSNLPMAWGVKPHPHLDVMIFSDMHSGLWAVELEPKRVFIP